MKRVCGLLAAAVVLGCAGPKTEPNINLAGYPPAFRAGYLDGCDSAKRSIGRKKDEERFKREAQYATGWRDGYDICKRQKQ